MTIGSFVKQLEPGYWIYERSGRRFAIKLFRHQGWKIYDLDSQDWVIGTFRVIGKGELDLVWLGKPPDGPAHTLIPGYTTMADAAAWLSTLFVDEHDQPADWPKVIPAIRESFLTAGTSSHDDEDEFQLGDLGDA